MKLQNKWANNPEGNVKHNGELNGSPFNQKKSSGGKYGLQI